MNKLEQIYGGKNDIFNHLEFTIGKRFIVVKDALCGYIGLFDKEFLNFPVMSNSTTEKVSNLEIIEKATGDVLIGGFGIGLIVLPIMNKTSVNSVHIVELHDEVIDFIAKKLPLTDKVKIIHHDIFTFIPQQKYDTIYFDTIPYGCNIDVHKRNREKDGEILEDKNLVEIYTKKYLNPGGYCNYFKPIHSINLQEE